MKMYVNWYRPIPEHQEALDSGIPLPGNQVIYDVALHPEPHRLFDCKNEAEEILLVLCALKVGTGDHDCHFEIEDVGRQYAIVCAEHPEPNSL